MDRNSFEPRPLAEVDHHVGDDGRSTLVFVREFRHEPTKVWAALTDPAQLSEWAPFIADRDLARTGAATLTMIDAEHAVDLIASVTRVEPPTLLEYTWGDDVLQWELEPVDGGTRLTLRHTVESGDWLPKVAAGWHLCLDVAELLLDGQPIGPIRGQDAMNYGWQELHDAYADGLASADG